MLLKEIGRFGDNIDNLKPTDLKQEVPLTLRRGNVGIFWHVGYGKFLIYSSDVLNNSTNTVEMGIDYDEDTNPDNLQIDYNYFHKDIWNNAVIHDHPEWSMFKYDHFSRGRVIFEVEDHKFTIYVPNTMNKYLGVINFLSREFNLRYSEFSVNSEIYKKKKDMDTINSCNKYVRVN